MTVSYDGNIVVAGTIIKLKNNAVKDILKKHLHDCVFDTYKITEDYIKLIFNSFELTKATQQLSTSNENYIVKDNTIFIRLNESAIIDELDEVAPEAAPVKAEEVKEEANPAPEAAPVKAEEVKEEANPAPEAAPEKEEEVEAPAPIELVIAPGDVLEKLAPGDYKIIFNGITFAILSQGDDRNYIKTEKVITITDQFKKLTGVSTAKKKK